MSIPAAYPKADQILRGDAPGSWAHNGPYKIVWHTTETLGLPSYDRDDDHLDAELAPHLTYDPKTRRWWQDYKLTRPSESLRVHDNDMVIQVEIICYSDKNTVDRYGGGRLWVGDLPDTAYQDLAEFTNWVRQYEKIPSVWPAPGRMTSAQFHAYNGHAGHVHVPDNTHWDPGVFDYKKLFDYIEREDDMVDRGTEVEPNPDLIDVFEEFRAAGIYTEHTQPGGVTFNDEQATFLKRAGVRPKRGARTWTKAEIASIATASAVAGAGADEVIAEIVRLLGG